METMQISRITLQNFRNYKKRSFDFSSDTTIIVGRNATGKTNILEAIYLLSTGKSFHARREEEMVGYEAEIARVSAEISGPKLDSDSDRSAKVKLEVVLTRGAIDIGAERPEKVPRKKLLVNGIGRHLYTFAGNLKVVLFGPWDMDIVTESPSIRRRFLDSVLSQVDREYRRSILSYEKGLRQRNKLLFKIREEGFSRNSLMFWDQLLIKAGNYITKSREEFIEFVNSFPDPQEQDFSIEYDRSIISEGRLDQYKDEEVSAATTLVGPHRDDFIFNLRRNKIRRDLARFGSRGEQRMGVLWLKLAELSYIEKESSEKPILLLDDIFSELDHVHRDIVMKIVRSSDQVVITTADEHFTQGFENKNIIKLA